MNKLNAYTFGKLLALVVLAQPLWAHRQWILPSTSILSGKDQWISVEAAISNDLFFPNHHAISLEQIKITDAKGAPVEMQHSVEGEIRSSFEVLLEGEGTYRIGTEGTRFFATWKEDGETKRWRGTKESFFSSELKEKPEVQLGEYDSVVETYVTSGAPTREILKPKGNGLELDFMTHPNDLFVSEKGRFRLLLDGQPVKAGKVTIVEGNDRFRNEVGEIIAITDADGVFEIDWPQAGRYWLSSTLQQDETHIEGIPVKKRASYVLTFEVLPD